VYSTKWKNTATQATLQLISQNWANNPTIGPKSCPASLPSNRNLSCQKIFFTPFTKFEYQHSKSWARPWFSPSLCFPLGLRVFLVAATAAVRSHRHSGRCHSIRGTIRPCPRHDCKGLSSVGSSVPGQRPKSGSCRGGRWSLHRRRAMLCHLLVSTSGDSGCLLIDSCVGSSITIRAGASSP
jgi:hypothetical protein